MVRGPCIHFDINLIFKAVVRQLTAAFYTSYFSQDIPVLLKLVKREYKNKRREKVEVKIHSKIYMNKVQLGFFVNENILTFLYKTCHQKKRQMRFAYKKEENSNHKLII